MGSKGNVRKNLSLIRMLTRDSTISLDTITDTVFEESANPVDLE